MDFKTFVVHREGLSGTLPSICDPHLLTKVYVDGSTTSMLETNYLGDKFRIFVIDLAGIVTNMVFV